MDVTNPSQLQALSSLPRQRILGILTTRSATLSALAAELGVPRASVSYHLRVLQRAGCVRVAGTATVRGGLQSQWVATAREFDFTAFSSQLGMPARLLRAAVDELQAADHGELEVTRTRRVRIHRTDFDHLAAKLNALFDELDRVRVVEPDRPADDQLGGVRAGRDNRVPDRDVHSVTLAAAFFRNQPRKGTD